MIKITIDPNAISLGDIEDGDKLQSITEVIDWLVKFTGADREELRHLKLGEIKELMQNIQDELTLQFQLPKAKRRR